MSKNKSKTPFKKKNQVSRANAKARKAAIISYNKGQQALAASKQTKYTAEYMEKLFSGRMAHNAIYGLTVQPTRVHNAPADYLIAMKKLCMAVLSIDYDFFAAQLTPTIWTTHVITALVKKRNQWIRDPADWKPKSHNLQRRTSSLIKHLLAKYPTPELFEFWFFAPQAHIDISDLYAHVAQGQSVKTYLESWFNITKKTAHELLCIPSSFGIMEAIRRAQLIAMGAEPNMISFFSRLVPCRILPGRDDENGKFISTQETTKTNDTFWLSVAHWFMQNPMLDFMQMQNLLDYFSFKIAEDPKWSIRKRSALKVLEASEQWHKETITISRMMKTRGNTEFPTCGISDIVHRNFSVSEVLSYEDLATEGQQLHHCVASYAKSIERGQTSIFSYKVNGQRVLTVSVMTDPLRIGSIAGLQNRQPTMSEKINIEFWATQNNMNYSAGKNRH